MNSKGGGHRLRSMINCDIVPIYAEIVLTHTGLSLLHINGPVPVVGELDLIQLIPYIHEVVSCFGRILVCSILPQLNRTPDTGGSVGYQPTAERP